MVEERRTTNIPVKTERRSLAKDNIEIISKLFNTMSIMSMITYDYIHFCANDYFYEHTGFKKEDVHNGIITLKDLMVENINYDVICKMDKKYINIQLKKQDGKLFTCKLFPEKITHKDREGILFVGIDITYETKIEKSLNSFFEYCPMPAFIKDRMGTIIKTTPFYLKNVAQHELDIIGKNVKDVFPNEMADKLNKEDEYIIKNKKPYTCEETLNERIYSKIKFPINGELIGGFSMDITDRVLIEQELEKTKENFKNLYNVLSSFLDTLPEMIWIYDENKNITFTNKALKEFSLNKLNIFDIKECMLLPNDTETFIKEIEINNETMYIQITKYPLFEENSDKIIGCSGKLEDITNLIVKQKRIIDKIDKLEQHNVVNKEVLQTLNNTIVQFSQQGWGLI
jgi:transcriptional regulator with PAS, ATPase and Fis domain